MGRTKLPRLRTSAKGYKMRNLKIKKPEETFFLKIEATQWFQFLYFHNFEIPHFSNKETINKE